MDIYQAIIQGLIQGLAEFLPISSSGHLILVESIYKIFTGKPLSSGGAQDIFFDIMLHLGTLIAVLIFFRNDIKNLLVNFVNSVKNGTLNSDEEGKFPVYIMIGTCATIALFLPFKNFSESLVNNPTSVGIALMCAGTIIFSAEFIASKFNVKTTLIGWKRAVAIGLAQALAGIIHGLSRSGTTISTGIASGLDRVTAARFSFLLSIPIILLAVLSDTIDLIKTGGFAGFNWTAILTGTIIAGIVGYYCVKYFIQFLGKNKLNIFAIYCWTVGLAAFLYFGVYLK